MVIDFPEEDVTESELGFFESRTSNFSLKVSVTTLGSELRVVPFLGSDETRVECASAKGAELTVSSNDVAIRRNFLIAPY